MLDVKNMPEYTTLECSMADLPNMVAGQVRQSPLENEVPNICVLYKRTIHLDVYAITPFCIIRASSRNLDKTSICTLVSAIEQITWTRGKDSGTVEIRTYSNHSESHYFSDFELLDKFVAEVFSVTRQSLHAK
ncbi:MAG: hypothetical protein M1282_03840 [Chloroflexi bacterium]|nr:hypothetical protein [Chloroflexota bacterium]